MTTAADVFNGCEFRTARTRVANWHGDRSEEDLAAGLMALLTDSVTRDLPDDWRGITTEAAAREFIRRRDGEGPTLVASQPAVGSLIGLIIIYAPDVAEASLLDVRLGYVVEEGRWGNGYASEIVQGLVRWCAADGRIGSLTAGVGAANRGSQRVLEKTGFEPVGSARSGEVVYRWTL